MMTSDFIAPSVMNDSFVSADPKVHALHDGKDKGSVIPEELRTPVGEKFGYRPKSNTGQVMWFGAIFIN